ncbi:MAG: hypothetical protein KJO01_07725 [Gammaproteobacteria bacterium]|nr:hypothetical protein [Gammaproteobacteria bacterium]MBT8109864.1 hypothetical protein [Gammaproteobacteria bacterium]NND46245.1 MnhB domain-containing protein [Woeseiaceae bacterium]NNL44566.1 MnhB domain-containing protein [Woeseiaceae bacterium]
MREKNTQTGTTDKQDQEIQALLKDYPMPEASTAFYDQALARATHEGSRRQRNRWIMTGFGSAVAAGLALWFVGGFFFATPVAPDAEAVIPGITMTLQEPRTVNLVFASTSALDSALLTITLPVGIELAGFPGQREVAWQTSLKEGKNLLPLKLVAVSPVGGEVLARLEHNDRSRTFRLAIDVS